MSITTDTSPLSRFEDMTVTGLNPLRVRRDGDATLDLEADTMVAGLRIDDRVRVESADGRLIVHGVAKGTRILASPASLGTGEDLNDYTEPGLYHQGSNAYAAAGSNYPEPRAGLLEVIVSGSFKYQRYTTYNGYGARTWTRNYFGSWGSWGLPSLLPTAQADLTAHTVNTGGIANYTHRQFSGYWVKNGMAVSNHEIVVPVTGVYLVTLETSWASANNWFHHGAVIAGNQAGEKAALTLRTISGHTNTFSSSDIANMSAGDRIYAISSTDTSYYSSGGRLCVSLLTTV